jgi:hypothetical protein
MRKKLLKLHKCTLKKETDRKRGHLERKMTEGKKVGPNDAHMGCVTKRDRSGAEWIKKGSVPHIRTQRTYLIVQCACLA